MAHSVRKKARFEPQERDASTEHISIEVNSIDSAQKRGYNSGRTSQMTMKIPGFQPEDRDASIGHDFTESTQLRRPRIAQPEERAASI
eukprot:scaffold46214_cov60-Attheya_sp.AAC.1